MKILIVNESYFIFFVLVYFVCFWLGEVIVISVKLYICYLFK